MSPRNAIVGLLFTALFPVHVAAQPPRADEVFRAVTADVRIDAIVKYKGAFLRDLKQENFVILDEGRSQATQSFEIASMPLDLVIVVESGGLTGPRKPLAGIAARVTAELRTNDRAAIVWDSDTHETMYNHLRLTSNRDEIASAMERIDKEWNSCNECLTSVRVHWASWMVEDDLQKRPPAERRKQALLLLSRVSESGGDPGDPVIQHLWSIQMPLHAILLPFRGFVYPALGPVISPRSAQPVYLAQQTGGDVLWTDEQGSLDKIPEFIHNIQSSYSLWFKAAQADSSSPSGSVRHITVELSDAAKKKYPGAEVIARKGYIVP